LAAIRQVLAPSQQTSPRRRDVRTGRRRLAAIRQVTAQFQTNGPGVATCARGDVDDDRRYGVRPLAAIRQGLAAKAQPEAQRQSFG
jgi:hypothetical protein